MIDSLTELALDEDIGKGDVTTNATVPEDLRARATIRQKSEGVIFGLDLAERVFRTLDREMAVERKCFEGEWGGDREVVVVEGKARAILTGERTALNFLQHLSGIATYTAQCVAAVKGTGVTLLDTRKTTPGLRLLEKQAVVSGGGSNHRVGLYDAILIKENHIAAAGGIAKAVELAHAANPGLLLEVECRNQGEVEEAITAGATRLLLDNLTPDELTTIVGAVAGRVQLEASGGISLENVASYASTGVEFISMGALTHSSKALDLSLMVEATE